MKKIVLSLCALLAFSGAAVAQNSFELTWNGEKVEEGQTIDIEVEEESIMPDPDDPSWVMWVVEGKSNPTPTTGMLLKNISASSINVKLVGTVLERGSQDFTIGICGGTNQCVDEVNGVATKDNVVLAAGASTALDYDAKAPTGFEKPAYGDTKTKLEISAGGETMTVYVNFNYSDPTAGIENVKAEGSLTYADNELAYSFSKAGHRLAVYTVAGAKVKSEVLAQSGNVSLAGLQRGVYLCEVTDGGTRVAVRKVVVE